MLVDIISFLSRIFRQRGEFRFSVVLISQITGMRNNRRKITDRNSFSAALKGLFFLHCYFSHPQVHWSTVSFHIGWCTSPPRAPASTAPCALRSQLPEAAVRRALGLPFGQPAPSHSASATSESVTCPPTALTRTLPSAGPASSCPGC